MEDPEICGRLHRQEEWQGRAGQGRQRRQQQTRVCGHRTCRAARLSAGKAWWIPYTRHSASGSACRQVGCRSDKM